MPPSVPVKRRRDTDPIPVFGNPFFESLVKRAPDVTYPQFGGLPGASVDSSSDTTTSSSVIPIGAGVFALVAVGALLFAKFGYKRPLEDHYETDPHVEKVKRGYIAEIEENFKLPQNILKSTTAAVNIGHNATPPLIFQDRQGATKFPQPLNQTSFDMLKSPGKVQLTPILTNISQSTRNTPPTLAPISTADAQQDNNLNLEYHESEYIPRKIIQAPRRKHSITLDIAPNQVIQQNRPSLKGAAGAMPHISDEISDEIENTLHNGENKLAKSIANSYAGSSAFLGASQGIFESANSSMTSVSVSSSKVLRYKVVEPWIPQRFDELDLHVGEIVHVYQTYKDGWCEGCVDGSEDEEGMFPRVCLGEFALSIGDLDKEYEHDGGIKAAMSSEAVADTEKQMLALKNARLDDVDRPPLEMVDVSLETPKEVDVDETPKATTFPELEEDVPDGFDTPRSRFLGDD
ncbi:hypothetical protein BDR26DRAFT_249535 [Obelidium mucronatum]|nr:hypothetical protein BDR26DRAFT_249535 [Obelidium mucronatum]